MAILSHDCPHCGTRNNGFVCAHAARHPQYRERWTALLLCPSCHGGLVATLSSARDPTQYPGDFRTAGDAGRVIVERVLPEPLGVNVPPFLPDAVAKAFKEGNDALAAGLPAAACAMFRRTLEIGLKALCPEVEAWRLEKRIDALAERHLITPAIQEWAHQLRLDGNEAVHGVADPSRDEARAMQSLTRFVLIYVFTLPGQIAASRQQAGAG